ncbi:hypothetical protein [Coleofasciculus sp. E1-EBD-02]|uniref:hypothetical protein n=1 Tax=Coleofasciculus sp. E1-EBD-02 TaxID=3068481 RepID=UPI0032FC9599
MSNNLCDRGYRREDLVLLFRLIDWFIALPKREEDRLWQEIQTLEKERKMPYITSVERIGIRKTQQENIIRILGVRFERIPHELRELIRRIEDYDMLDTFLVQAVKTKSLEAFESVANQLVTEAGSGLENTEPSLGEGAKGK